MRHWLIGMALLTTLHGVSAASAQASACTATNEAAGVGLAVIRRCTAMPDATIAPEDVYYQVDVVVRPEPGFANNAVFDKKSAGGKILAGLLKSVFNREKSTNLDIGLTISQDTARYPVMSLMNFQLTDGKTWRSSVSNNNATMLHKLTPGAAFKVEFSYAFSRTDRIDFKAAGSIVTSLGVKLVTPAIAPILNTAGDAVKATLAASGVDIRSRNDFELAPWPERTAVVEYVLTDQAGNRLARVQIGLSGTLSLLAAPRDLGALRATLPTGNVAAPLMTLPKLLIAGQARDWPLVNAALGATSNLDAVLGKELTEQTLLTFCGQVEAGVATAYSLTSFDALLVRARLVEAATANIRPRINPYQRCFGTADRATIAARLGIATETQETGGADKSRPLPFEALQLLGCVLRGAQGDCDGLAAGRVQLGEWLGPTIEIRALDTLPPSFSAGLPADFRIGPADFLARFAGKFARYRDVSRATQSVVVHETADGPGLRLKAFADADGRIGAVEFRSLGGSSN